MKCPTLYRVFFLVIVLSGALWARGADRVMIGEDILVAQGEELGDVVCIGCSIRVEGTVTGDVVAVGGSVEIDGEVEGDLVAVAGSATVRGKVRNDAVAFLGSLELYPGAEVEGDAVAVTGAVTVPDGAEIGGEIISAPGMGHVAFSGMLVLLLVSLLAGLIVQPLLVLLCLLILGSERVRVLADTASRRAGMSLLIGSGLVVGSVMLSVTTAVIPVAIPGLHFPLGLAFFIVLVVGYTGISYWVGRGLLPQSSLTTAALLGAVLVTIMQMIPLVGWLAWMVFSLMALGSALLSGFGTSVDWLAQRTAPNSATPGPARSG